MLSKARFQSLLPFARKKHRAGAGVFFVDGWRWLDEVLLAGVRVECLLAAPGAARTEAEAGLLERARAAAGEFHEASATQLERLTGSVSSSGVAALVAWGAGSVEALIARLPARGPALIVALDGVGDPGNAGTLVRSADWFGLAGVVFGADAVEPTNPKVVRATMGSLFHLPVGVAESLPVALALFRDAGYAAVGATLDGERLTHLAWPARAVVVVGNEAGGIRPEVAAALDQRVQIPPHGQAESLNAAVAGSILMHDWRRAVSG